ncbi:MAG: ribosome assembly RNA-binding protein YhbY [Candidatus Marinimicrobia bacterium]|nr:ribosome assembly RNA-binding protein YhbY [Candidatus Neomarinimicrobiota bacterium]MDP6936142.1 ribosome assembly RNA-binding protein YhbY [Candidatus Neomarinimicrobiota bacterium]
MNKLTSRQRAYLKSKAHHLEPVVLIGKNKVAEGTLSSIDKALKARELIKIKFREYKDEKIALAQYIQDELQAEIVGIVGHTLILFKQHPDQEKQIYPLN